MGALDMSETSSEPVSPKPSFAESVRVFARIGLLSFGGPAGQIALMHRVLVDEKRWIDERSYLNALNFCMLLPGPEAMQLATYVGWRQHGVLEWDRERPAGWLCGAPAARVYGHTTRATPAGGVPGGRWSDISRRIIARVR